MTEKEHKTQNAHTTREKQMPEGLLPSGMSDEGKSGDGDPHVRL